MNTVKVTRHTIEFTLRGVRHRRVTYREQKATRFVTWLQENSISFVHTKISSTYSVRYLAGVLGLVVLGVAAVGLWVGNFIRLVDTRGFGLAVLLHSLSILLVGIPLARYLDHVRKQK